jgi:hypothetical protein
MDKDEALKLALEALESCDFVYTFGNSGYQQFDRPSVDKAITAIKQALAAQQEHEPENEPFVSLASVQEPVDGTQVSKVWWDGEKLMAKPIPLEDIYQPVDWKAEYLKSVESGCITLDELREARAELDATNRQVEILSDALAESQREVDAMVALARADERERIKEENQRCYAVKGTAK